MSILTRAVYSVLLPMAMAATIQPGRKTIASNFAADTLDNDGALANVDLSLGVVK